ncbi:hypothetical protein [Streptomyces sp. NPDC047974]|uniref:hypothetical protein n=1 Tax=Streptomyces sp. NPDC047974 TaxID=3154343 RepID=UPI0033FCF6F7
MSDSTHHYHGDVVNMHGGQGNQGIVHHHAPAPALTPEQALAAVRELAEALRTQLPDADREALDEGLAGLDEAAAGPERRRTLLAIAGIAATVGTLGQPLLDSVRAALELLGS